MAFNPAQIFTTIGAGFFAPQWPDKSFVSLIKRDQKEQRYHHAQINLQSLGTISEKGHSKIDQMREAE